MLRDRIADQLWELAQRAGANGERPDFEVGRPRNAAFGDFQSAAGLKLQKQLREAPPAIAARLAAAFELEEVSAEAVGPFVNFRFRREWLQKLVSEVAKKGPSYGSSGVGGQEEVQVEHLSTNPTGPLHIGHGRGAILGDSLANLLAFTGHAVEREYYVNDYGTQAHRFGASILARLNGEPAPEGGYSGDYVEELAAEARAAGVQPTVEALMEFGIARMIERFKVLLERLRVRYDEWYSERELWRQGDAQEAIELLKSKGLLAERDGAVWFAPALAGDEDLEEEARVVFRANGEHTYFGSDLGYLLNRFRRRGFQRVIEVWGSDHHGYVPRMKQAAAALDIDPDQLVVILNQFVTLKEGKMSKRAGRFVTLEELVDLVGADAVRYFYLSRTPDTQMEFDLDLAVTQNKTNPVYYVQYAHARLSGIERTAEERHAELPGMADVNLLDKPWELDVARVIAAWPDVVEEAARLLEPHRITYYLYELADRVSDFYEAGNRDGENRVVVDDAELTRARLELSRAARATLRSGLDLIGVTAPERM